MIKLKTISLSEKINKEATIGDAEQLSILIAQSKKPTNFNITLFLASENGHSECVKFLIPLSNPKNKNSEALRIASLKGHVESVKLLIPFSAPKTLTVKR